MSVHGSMATNDWEDWQAGKTPSEAISHLLSEELYTDVTFSFPGSSSVVKAHKLILASRSPVFERMFYGSLPEDGEEVQITDTEPETFQLFIRYLYTEDKTVVGEDDAGDLLYVSEKYQIPSLRSLCETLSRPGIDEKNSIEKLDDAVRTGNLTAEYMNDVCLLGTELRDVPTRLNLSHSSLETIVECEFIGMSELNLFRMCNDWAIRECGERGYPATPDRKRQVLGDVFQKVRLPLLTPEELARFVLPTGYLTVDEERLFLRHQCGVRNLVLPYNSNRRAGLNLSYDDIGHTLIIDCYRPKWQILGFVVKQNVALNISCKAEGAVIYGEYCCSFITGKSYICIPEIKRRRIQLTIRAVGGSPVLDSSTCARISPDFGPEQVIALDMGANIPCTGLIYSLSKTYF